MLAPYYILLHLWIDVFGDSAAAMRLPSVLAMAGAAGLLALLGRRMFDQWTGLAAGTIFAVLPITTRYAQEARPYACAVLAAVASTLLLYRALDHPTLKRWAAYGVLIPCMGMAHLVTLLILPAHLLTVVSSTRRRGRLGPWLASVAVGVLPVLPIAYAGHKQAGQVSWIAASTHSLWQMPPSLFHSRPIAWTITSAAILSVPLLRRPAAALLCWAIVPLLLLFATRTELNLFLSRYLLFTIPAWTLLAAAGLCAVVRHLPGPAPTLAGRQVTAAVVAALALFTISLPDAALVRSNPLPGEPDWAGAAQWVAAHSKPRDGFALNGYRLGRLALAYQWRHTPSAPADVFLGRTGQTLGSFDAGTCPDTSACTRNTDRIWLFSTQPMGHSFSQMPEKVAISLESQFKITRVKAFPSVRVLILLRVHPAAAETLHTQTARS
ncbi:glycosyltransferase family 39 protein [Streptomyces sp. NPDC002078]